MDANAGPSVCRFKPARDQSDSACNDGFDTYAAARYTAEHIVGARLLGFERGGHLPLGHQPEVVEAGEALLLQSGSSRMTDSSQMRILLVDDHAVVREGLARIVERADRGWKVAAGGVFITAALAESVVQRLNGATAAPRHAELSNRELDDLRRIVAGQGLTEIAEPLHLSVKTVSTHKRNIMDKLALPTTAAPIRYRMEQGLVDGA